MLTWGIDHGCNPAILSFRKNIAVAQSITKETQKPLKEYRTRGENYSCNIGLTYLTRIIHEGN